MNMAAAPQAEAESTRQMRNANAIFSQFEAVAKSDRWTAFAVIDWIREKYAPQHPEIAAVTDAGLQDDADWWADFATDQQVVAMLSACLKRLSKRQPIGTAARKRALVALWNTLNDQDRAAFLEMADPGTKGKA